MGDVTRDDVIGLLHQLNFNPSKGPHFDKAVDEVHRRLQGNPDFRSGEGILQNLPLECHYTWSWVRQDQHPIDVDVNPPLGLAQGHPMFINHVKVDYTRFESQASSGDVSRAVITLRHPVPLNFAKGMKIEVVVRPPEEAGTDGVDLYVARRAMTDVTHWIMRGVVEKYRLSVSHDVVEVTCIVEEGGRRYNMPPPAVGDNRNNPQLLALWEFMEKRAVDGRVGLEILADTEEHLGLSAHDIEGLVRWLQDARCITLEMRADNLGNAEPVGYNLCDAGHVYFGRSDD